jgi:hypothetical protein
VVVVLALALVAGVVKKKQWYDRTGWPIIKALAEYSRALDSNIGR